MSGVKMSAAAIFTLSVNASKTQGYGTSTRTDMLGSLAVHDTSESQVCDQIS